MEFMGIAVGILALICALVLLFGRHGTRRILGWGIAIAILGVIAFGIFLRYTDPAFAPRQHTQDTSGQQAPTSQRGLTDEEVGLCGTATTPACENGFAVAPGHHAWEYDPIIKCPDNRTAPVQLNSGIWVCQ